MAGEHPFRMTTTTAESEPETHGDLPNVVAAFTSHILTPGSSINPIFLIVVDGIIVLLLFVFVVLLFVTRGNLHFLALICITLALWASIKWYIAELRAMDQDQPNPSKKKE